LSDNSRKKGFAAAQQLLGPDVNVIDYSVGMSGSWPTGVVLTMLAAWLLLTVALMLLLHTLVIVGVIPMIALRYLLNRPVGIATAPQGVALLERSFWNGRPNAVAALLPAGALLATEDRGNWVQLLAPPHSFWITKRELPRVQAFLRVGGPDAGSITASGPLAPNGFAPSGPLQDVPPSSPNVGYF
jgi:hypothetical protein